MLIEGVEAGQFMEAGEAVPETQEPVDILPGDYVVRSTLLVSGRSVAIASFNGPLVLTCFRCRRCNEMKRHCRG